MRFPIIRRIGTCLLAATLLCVLLAPPLLCGVAAESRPNIAQGKTAYASSNQRGSDPHLGRRTVRFLTDGSEDNFIVLHEDDPDPWFMVDLGALTAIDTVTLHWGAGDGYPDAYATRYEVQVNTQDTDDGWQTVATVTDGKAGTRTLTFDSVTTRYVRLKVQEKAAQWVSLFEWKIYETPTDTDNPKEDSPMKVLFIGNSHTYTNDVPVIVQDMLTAAGVTMEYRSITAGGQTLAWHSRQTDTINAIRSDAYDFIILQEKASGFDAAEFQSGYTALYSEIAKTHAQPVLYMIWSNESKPQLQRVIANAYAAAAKDTGARLAAAGVAWDILRHTHTDLKLYQDGNHATPLGSYLASASICYALTGRQEPFAVSSGDALARRLHISEDLATLMQTTAHTVAQRGYDVIDLVWNGDGETNRNLAQGQTAYASSNQRGSDPHLGRRTVRFLTDGSEDNFIVLHEDDTERWFMVDFAQSTTIAALRLAWGATDAPYANSFATQYDVQVSDTEDEWRTIATITDGALETRLLTFEPVSARYLRVLVREKSNTYVSMRELYAYAKAADTPEATDARDALQKQIDTAVDLSLYTDESVAAYQAVVATATALLKDDAATPAALRAMCQAVVQAQADLTARVSFLAGDANGDGRLTTADAAQILQKAAELIDDSAIDGQAADVNGDGRVTTADAALVLQKAAELIDRFPIE